MIPDRYTGVSGSNPGPVEGLLVFLDVPLHRATLIVAGCGYFDGELNYGALGDTDFASAPQAGHGPRKITTGCMER